MKILVISGSIRAGAYSATLGRATGELAPGSAEVSFYEGLGSIPAFDQDLEPGRTPEPVTDLRRRIEGTDALLLVTPEYNASIPGALKNAIDWASRPHGSSALMGRPTAIVSTAPSPFGGAWANQHLRKILTITGTPVVETELAIGKVDTKLGPDGALTDDETREAFASLLAELEQLLAETERARAEQPEKQPA